MYDPWGTYHTVEEAIRVGRELERLDFLWFEHPMPEYRVESYVRLARELTIPILSPEITEGNVFTRADWILRGASDMSRMDVNRGDHGRQEDGDRLRGVRGQVRDPHERLGQSSVARLGERGHLRIL